MAGFRLIRKALGILGCALILSGTPGIVERGRAQGSDLEQARTAMQRGDTAKAMSLLQSWIAAHPRDVTARLMLGDAYRVNGQSRLAEAQFKEVLKISPNNLAALIELGSFYAEAGRFDLAEPFLARASRKDPHSAVARMEWATVLSKLHKFQEASEAIRGVTPPTARDQRISWERLKASIDFGLGNAVAAAADMEAALVLAPKDQGLQIATGIVESKAGHWTRTIELLGPIFRDTHNPQVGIALLEATIATHQDYRPLLDALRVAGRNSSDELSLRLGLAQILVQHNLYEEAAEDFERAVALEPGQANLLYNLALARFRAGNLDGALQSAQHAKSVQDSASIESLLGEIQEERGDSLAAAHSLQAAVALSPGNEGYRLSLGLELLKHETFKPALVVFREGARLFPKSLRMRVALGLTYYFLEQYDDATNTLEAAAELGEDPSIPLEYLGRIQLQQIVKPDAGALKQLCSYADAHPKSGKIQAYCGALLVRVAHDQGNLPPAKAISRLRNAARLEPKEPTAHCELGKALDWAHQWTESRRELEACVHLDPNSVDAHYLLAGIYRRLGDMDLAEKEIKLHDQAVRHMVQSNAHRDSTLEKFLVTMRSPKSN